MRGGFKKLLNTVSLTNIFSFGVSHDISNSMPKRKHLKIGSSFAKRSKTSMDVADPPFVEGQIKFDMSKVEILANPRKSINDKKEYRVIRLENGLRCLLISDVAYPLDKLDQEELEEDSIEEESDGNEESSDEEGDESSDIGDESEEEDIDGRPSRKIESTGLKMSAAGLMVHMGSFSDPDDIPGLAHFLEHMVFMGSEKYPDENGFDSFIAKHGGYDNASTDTETTVFYFESPRRYFREGLDRFAQFFIAPLMKQNAMEREREAVDSEYQMALPSDENRLAQVMGGLAKAGHPMAKFMWGNKVSLSPTGLSDEEIHGKLHEFRLRHYTAQAMYLTVQSQQNLDTLQDWVVQSYSGIPNNGMEREEFSQLLEPFSSPAWPLLYRLIPVQNEYKVDLTWALPPAQHHYRIKPLHYLAHLLGHEGKGSLVSFLRRKVWALSLTAGNAGDGFEYNSTYSLFPITITLTKEGFDNVQEVVRAVFCYIDMIKAEPPSERIFQEIKKIEDLAFTFSEEKQAAENVEDLCENMGFYPPEHYLDGDDLLFDFDPNVVQKYMDGLDRKSVNIFLRSKEVASESLDKKEPWFGTQFSSESIPKKWKEPCTELSKEFHLPLPNLFIASDTSLCPSVEAPSPGKIPVLLVEDLQGELYHKQDRTFLQPRSYIHYLLRSSLQLESPESACLMDLMVMCLLQNIVEDVYPADLAQLNYSLYAGENGLIIKVSGLSDKLPALLDVIVQRLASFTTDTTEKMFLAVVEQQRKNYHNHSNKPKHLVRDVRLSVLQDVFFPAHTRHNLVRQFSLKQVNDFATKFLGCVFLHGLVQGNITKEQALQLDTRVRTGLACSPLSKDAKSDLRCKNLPLGQFILHVEGLDKKDTNTLVTNYYQAGPGNLRNHAVLETIVMMMEEPVFDTLRTQEQLGYHVTITLRNTHGVLGVSVTVNTQANKFSAEHVDKRIEAFFKNFIENDLNEEKVAEAVTALTKLKTRADVKLEEEMHRHWNEIISKEYLFNRAEKEVEALASIGLEDVKSCLNPLLKDRKLSVQVEGRPAPEATQESVIEDSDTADISLVYQAGENFISDPVAWKNDLTTYPVIYITK